MRNPRSVAQSISEFPPHRQYCRRGRNSQIGQATARGFHQKPKDPRWANFGFPIPRALPGSGEIQEQSPRPPGQSGNFRHAENIAGAAEIPRLNGRTLADFAKSTGSRQVSMVSLGISATPPILLEWKKYPDQLGDCSRISPKRERSSARGNSKSPHPNDFRVLATSASSLPVNLAILGISATPTILPAWQKSPD